MHVWCASMCGAGAVSWCGQQTASACVHAQAHDFTDNSYLGKYHEIKQMSLISIF
jgi:hypothetical protein